MSILIKEMDMPISCEKCPLCYDYLHCSIDDSLHMFLYNRHPNCPLVEIPTPHGRLIDGEKLCYEFIDWQYAEAPDHLNTKEGRMVTDHERQYEIYLALGEAVIAIANAPTILEAEE